MNRGLTRISPEFFEKVLELPSNWRIRNIHMNEGDLYVKVMIEGPEFPDDAHGVKEVILLVHKTATRFEVKEIE